MTIDTIVLSSIAGIILLLIYFLRGVQDRATGHFRRTLGYMILWCVSIIVTEYDTAHALYWARLSFVFPILLVLSFHVFTNSLIFSKLGGKVLQKQHIITIIAYCIGVPFAAVCLLTPLVQENVHNLVSTFGPLQPYYGVFLILNFMLIIRALIEGTHRVHGHGVAQVKLILGGVITSATIAIIGGIFVPYLGFGEIRYLGPLGLIFFLGSTVYAITVHHLFDIRVVVKRTVIFTGLLSFVFAIYSAIIVLFSEIFQKGSYITLANYFVNLVATLVIGFSFEPLRRWISDRTDKWLFKKEFEQQTVISNLNKRLNDVIAMDEALEIMMQTITHVLHLHHAVTYVFQPAENNGIAVKRVKQIGYNSTTNLILDDNDFALAYFAEHGQIVLTQDMQMEIEQEKELLKDKHRKQDATFIRQHAIKQAVYKKLEQLDIALAIPLHLNNQPIGLIFLSEKLNGEGYHTQDMAMLELVGAQAISSIQKAKLYEGDQMKSEFVSIASHELLTPISAIEGYLSMILEEHIGKVDPQAEEYLTKVYSSAKRLSALIKDLLSVSRIESGKMKIIAQQLDVDKAIKETIDQLRFIAADKKLELIYHQSPETLPPVWADPDRMAQVLVNLLSNAIKYTPQGSVTITPKLDKRTGIISIAIADTGLGMSKQAVQHLFNKFYRVDTPETAGIAGTGLGLYITKSLIEKMGGNIEVKSTEGKGSVFTFTLPLFKVETSTAQ